MGIINPTNDLTFKSSQTLFDRIKKRLSSFDESGLIDEGDFHKHVVYIMEQLGQAVYKECEAVIPIKDRQGKLPNNMRVFHSAVRCSANVETPELLNEQVFIYYKDAKVECTDDCNISCCNTNGEDNITVKIYQDKVEKQCNYENIRPLILSPNVRALCTEDGIPNYCPGASEITLDIEGRKMYTVFDNDYVYMQYYGIPVDEYNLPMIPANETIEKAIEYYIYTQLFEEFYWNTTVPGIANMLQDARSQADFFYAQARYYVKLPSFKKMVDSIRRMRNQRKFYQFNFDRTRI